MADDVREASPKAEPASVQTNEDAETRAARRELKQSSISDQPAVPAEGSVDKNDDSTAQPESPADDGSDAQASYNDDLKEQVSSPKKKRAHDQVEGDVQAQDIDATSVASTDSGKDRATRLEPEKKRHRDEELKEEEAQEPTGQKTNTTDGSKESPAKKETQTSMSAFASSGFGKLATGSSPFASLGGSQTSAFGTSTGTPPLTSFASPTKPPAPQAPAAAPKLTFGGASATSPFAGLSGTSNGFGGGLSGSGFGSALSGAKTLGSFAAPGTKPFQSEKPAKPFGAPDSDDDDDDGDDAEDDEEAQADENERAASPEKETEEKKKLRLQKVEVNDGEAGESTLVSVRAKMFVHNKETGWKERGGGMLKINAPTSCVDFDDAGAVIPGSFDASGLEEEADGDDTAESQGPKVVRLLMRQDQTHRVLLNTAIVPAMKFQEKASLKSVGILFTAFEGEDAKPVSVTMRMSAASAKSFLNEISNVQKELQGN